jgi:hypothetical protein
VLDDDVAGYRASVPEIAAYQLVVPEAVESGFILLAEGAKQEPRRLDRKVSHG